MKRNPALAQALLHSDAEAQRGSDAAQPSAAAPDQARQQDLVPISAWLGQPGSFPGSSSNSIAELEAMEAAAALRDARASNGASSYMQDASARDKDAGSSGRGWEEASGQPVQQHSGPGAPGSNREGVEQDAPEDLAGYSGSYLQEAGGGQTESSARGYNGAREDSFGSGEGALQQGRMQQAEADTGVYTGAGSMGRSPERQRRPPEAFGGTNGSLPVADGPGMRQQLQQQQQEEQPDVQGDPYGALLPQQRLEALVAEGKGALREGRELARAGVEFGRADALLQDAMAAFEDAVALDPDSIKVLVRDQHLCCTVRRASCDVIQDSLHACIAFFQALLPTVGWRMPRCMQL